MPMKTIICCSALVAFAASTALAQTKDKFSGSCTSDPSQSVPAGDQPDHSFTISRGKCTVNGQIGGATTKGGTFAEHADVTATRSRSWGVHVVTVESGDTIFLNYQNTFVMQGDAVKSGHLTYQAIGGTGKLKGIKGAGTCTWSNGGDIYTCIGHTSLVAAAGAK